jgi:hypothetical protein
VNYPGPGRSASVLRENPPSSAQRPQRQFRQSL